MLTVRRALCARCRTPGSPLGIRINTPSQYTRSLSPEQMPWGPGLMCVQGANGLMMFSIVLFGDIVA